MAPRIYITGSVALEFNGTLIDERRLAGRQGRLAFVYLVSNRARAITRDDLIDVLWADHPPGEIETALSAILSKLRAAFKNAGIADAGIELRMGTVTLRLPSDTQVDFEDAANAIDEAEGALRRGDTRQAWSHANVAVVIAKRPFLAREDAPWIEARRVTLLAILSRGLYVLSVASQAHGETALAVQHANEMVQLEPFRETGYQHLMRLHAEMGNRGEALRVFGRLREVLRDELGTSPSPQTEAVFRKILTA